MDGPGQVYLFDRDHTVFAAPQLAFPNRKGPHRDTLVDGVSEKGIYHSII